MAVLPNAMEELDPHDVGGSFRTLMEYIEYMREQIEYANTQTLRKIEEVKPDGKA